MRDFDAVMKDSPGVGDVHQGTVLGNARRRRRRPGERAILTDPPVVKTTTPSDAEGAWRIDVPILKADEELRTVYGWASVINEAGSVVTDHQGDQITEAELVRAAHEFVGASRHGGLLHAQGADGLPHRGGEVVESLVLTPDVQKAIGVDLKKTGWFIGYRVADDDAWALVKDGTLRSFSIGGKASRVPVEG
jgi:Putative phage serine protease XkdF